MDALNNLMYGFGIALEPINIAYVFAGVFAGTIIGMLPGLGPISALALMIPITFAMEPSSGLILMAGVYYGAIFGGSTSSILLNAPGVAGTVATSFDGYPMAKQGMAGKALAIAAYASFIGGTVSVIFLMLVAPLLSKVAVSFGPAEYFALMVLGLTAVVSLSDKSLVKGLIAAVVGVMISIVGIDTQTGTERFTFNSIQLLDGIDFLVVALGIFALAEVFYMLLRGGGGKEAPRNTIGSLKLSRGEVKKIAGPIGRSSVLGFFTGVLPGAGATIGSFLGYSMEKRLAKDGDTFGQGNIKGVAAPEAANNASAAGSFVPMLTLGIPGSGTTAILLGALMLYNINPGPMMFREQPVVVGGLIASLYIGNVMLLLLNLPLAGVFARVLQVPRWLLVPSVAILAFVGVYQLHSDLMAIYLMLVIGVFGYLLRKFGFSLAPVVLGFVLGGLMEENLRRALSISGGDVGILFQSGLSIGLWIAAALVVLVPMFAGKLKAKFIPQKI